MNISLSVDDDNDNDDEVDLRCVSRHKKIVSLGAP